MTVCLLLQEDFLQCMHKRMEDILAEGEAIADLLAPGLQQSAAAGEPCALACY